MYLNLYPSAILAVKMPNSILNDEHIRATPQSRPTIPMPHPAASILPPGFP